MRIVLIAAVAIACGRIGIDPVGTAGSAGRDCARGSALYHSGETFAVGDGCNSCTCTDGTIACTTNACADACLTCPDGATGVGACDASGGCPSGPLCAGSICCGFGEQCVGGTCMCGASPACTGLDMCKSGSGTTPTISCGTLCCHGATCPL